MRLTANNNFAAEVNRRLRYEKRANVVLLLHLSCVLHIVNARAGLEAGHRIRGQSRSCRKPVDPAYNHTSSGSLI